MQYFATIKRFFVLNSHCLLYNSPLFNKGYKLVIICMLLSAMAVYCETIRLGMPTKRWVVCGLIIGPVSWIFLKMHYRRAILKMMQRDRYRCFNVS